jgi:sensor histidine kinase YesM
MTGLLIIPTAKVINLFSKRSVSASRLKDNTLLIAGINELNLFRLQDTLLFPLNNIPVQNTIASDIQSVPGLTAITTFEQGVFLWSGKQNLNFTVKNGLCDNSCKSICIDHENELWVTTSSGLNHIFRNDRTQPFSVEHLSIKNGLISNDLNQLFHIKSLYYVTSSKGISVFSKALFQPSDAEPVMDIHDIEINHRPHFEQQDLHLKAGEQHLKVTISAIDYRSFGNLNFRYKVDGLDSTWNYTSNQEIAFEQLQPGRYQLIVQSVNSLNHISKNVKTLRFTVHPFWWQRTGVQLLLALAILALGFYVLYRYLQKRYLLKLEQEKLLKQLSETELKAIKAQINPHFIFNTLNAIQFFISNNENDRAIIYLNLMSKLIRNTLDISNEISIPLHREIQYIQDYIALEALRFEEDEFEYSCSCDLPENETKQAFPTMVLQPLIENALRHGLKPKKTGKKILQVRFFKKEGYLVATVEDNGIGRKHAALLKSKSSIQHQSQGVNLSQSKLEIFRSQEHRKVKLETEDLFENDVPAGTRVILSIEQ